MLDARFWNIVCIGEELVRAAPRDQYGVQWPERGLQRQEQNVQRRSTGQTHCPTPEEVARHELTHLPAAAWCKASVSFWRADEQRREIFGREKSDCDVPPVKQLYRPLQPEPHFKSAQLVSDVDDLNKQVTSPSRERSIGRR